MNYNDYYQQVKNDAIAAIDEQFDCGYWDDDTEWDVVYDNLFVDDAVTGNGSGSYFFNAYRAKENIKDAIFDDYILVALENMGVDKEEVFSQMLNKDYETLDVMIRCAVLSDVYGDIEAYFHDCQSNCE